MMKQIDKTQFFLYLLFLAFLPYCYLSFFSNPSSDDFGFAVQAKENDMFHLIKQTYLYWNGRYISNVFIYLNPISYGSFIGYKIIPILIIGLFVSSSYYFIKHLLYNLSKEKQLIIALIFSLIFIHNVPIISEGFYWFTGAVIYQLGIIFTLIYGGIFIKTTRAKSQPYKVIVLSFLLFIVCGFNEVLTLSILLILAIITAVFYKQKLKAKRIVLSQFVLVIIFTTIMLFSPGNEYRESVYENAHNFSHSFLSSLLQTVRFSAIWITSLPLILATLFYYHLNKKLSEKIEIFSNSFYLNRFVSLLMLFAIIFICVFPAYWATGILGQHRTLNIAYFFFIIMWFINLTIWLNHYSKTSFVIQKQAKTFLGIFLLIGLIFTGNGYNSLVDIFSGSAKKYNTEIQARFKKLKSLSASKNMISLSPIEARPKTLFVSDITQDPKDWHNRAYSLYFRIDSSKIIVKDD